MEVKEGEMMRGASLVWFPWYLTSFPFYQNAETSSRFVFTGTSHEERSAFYRSLAADGGDRMGDASRRHVRTETRSRWRWSKQWTYDQYQCCTCFFSSRSLPPSSINFLWVSFILSLHTILLSMLVLWLNFWNISFRFTLLLVIGI